MRPNSVETGGFEKSGRFPAFAVDPRYIAIWFAASLTPAAILGPSWASAGKTSAAISSDVCNNRKANLQFEKINFQRESSHHINRR
jgi:hypothetical protein